MAENKKPKATAKATEPAPRVDAGEGTVDGVKVSRLQVRALKAGFRRAGRAWPAEETTVSVDEFTAEQIEQLLAEPMLVVLPIAAE